MRWRQVTRRQERPRPRETKQAETMLQWLPFEPERAMYNLLDGTQKEERGEQKLR